MAETAAAPPATEDDLRRMLAEEIAAIHTDILHGSTDPDDIRTLVDAQHQLILDWRYPG